MTKCLNCGKEFHTCPSCGLAGAQWEYCSGNCYEQAGNPVYTWSGVRWDTLTLEERAEYGEYEYGSNWFKPSEILYKSQYGSKARAVKVSRINKIKEP